MKYLDIENDWYTIWTDIVQNTLPSKSKSKELETVYLERQITKKP